MHSPSRSSGKYIAEFTPKVSWMRPSRAGTSMSDQSGRCNIRLSTIARETKLAFGSIGTRSGTKSAIGPSGFAPAAGR